MFDNWTFGKKVGAGFALAGAILALIATVGFRTSEQLIENDRWVDHTHEVRTALAELTTQLARTEGAMRGYVISQQDLFLQTYQVALDATKHTLETVRSLTADEVRDAAGGRICLPDSCGGQTCPRSVCTITVDSTL